MQLAAHVCDALGKNAAAIQWPIGIPRGAISTSFRRVVYPYLFLNHQGPSMRSDLDNPSKPRVWLTGASYGIGRAVALEYAQRGAFIGLTARSEDLLKDLLEEIRAAGGEGMVLAGDVKDRDAMLQNAATMQSHTGGIDILIANAGSHLASEVESFDAEQYMGLMELNYAGSLNCIQAVLPEMLRQGSGHIVGVASLAGYRGVPSAAAYGASKAALIHFLESLRFHVAPEGVQVTIVNPGFVRTPLTDKNDFKMPFMIEADKAARIMCNGIRRGRREITFPFLFATFVKLLRILPMPLYIMLMKMTWKRMQKG